MSLNESRSRPLRLYWIIGALWATLAGAAWTGLAAQRQAAPRRAFPLGSASAQKPLVWGKTPAVDLRRIDPHSPEGKALADGTIHALAVGPGPSPSPPSWFDLTTYPLPPQPGDSTLSRDLHPFYASDQRSIFFDSDRIDLLGRS